MRDIVESALARFLVLSLIAVSGCASTRDAPRSANASPDEVPHSTAGSGTSVASGSDVVAHLGRVSDRSGVLHDLDAELRSGKRVVLVFWQSWCAPCRREAPGIQQASRRYADGLAFYGVITGSDDDVDDAAVDRFIHDAGLTYPQIRDRDAGLWHRYEIVGTPTIVVIDTNGKVIYRDHRPPIWSSITPSRGDAGPVSTAGNAADPPWVERRRELGVMGTSLEITAIGHDASELEEAIDAAVAELVRVEDMMTSWRPSPLNALNDAAGRGPRSTTPEIARLVARALEIGRLTDGAFDITFASVGKLWDFKADPPVLPSDGAIEERLQYVGYQRVGVDLDANTVALPEGTRIGLGGIAKGYGVDRAMRVLLDHGVENAIVNAGGDMKVLGTNHGRPWEIAIKHPRDRERALAVLRLSNTCLVTSGDYERFFELDGTRYHHILDPRTGRPATGAMSASVVAQDAAFADALATALCVLGPERGLAIIERLPRVEALVVDLDGDVHVSSGLQELVEANRSS
ncbi:MAG: FAD:protein FMN transferase [Planctomycetes bacterium]|nr:FAD:protein FMN transferase [Planctomycetota bacterium]